MKRALGVHLAVIAALAVMGLMLPVYHHGRVADIMVLAVYAMGYNLLFGYTGLLSLGHAMFFAAGMYGAGMAMRHLGATPGPALIAGIAFGTVFAAAIGALILRTAGVAFMIVTLMFAQATYLVILYFGAWTRGDEGFVIQQADRVLAGLDLTDPAIRYGAALIVFAAALMLSLWVVRSRFGRVLVAIRENEERARMLGYDVYRYKLGAVILSGSFAATAGALHGLLFGYVGASFAAVQFSILPLLWVLLGGAGTTLGPLIGTLFTVYLIDIASGLTTAHLLVVGVVLVLVTLFARQGIGGEIRARLWRGMP